MILVIGGTGVIGSRVVEGLLALQCPVRILSAGLSDWNSDLVPAFRRAGVDIFNGDIRDQRAVAEAVVGCTGIVHAAGTINPKQNQTLQSVNVESVASLIPIAENAGVQRLVYVSCLGATQFSTSEYFRTKWQAEALIRQSNFAWTIFRPALVFGQECQLFRGLQFWLSRFPIILSVGSGLNHIAAVSAEDVGAAVVQSIYNRDTVGKTYSLVGPKTYTLAEILEMASQYYAGKEKPLLRIPASLAYRMADLFARINPQVPLSGEFMKVISSDFTADPAVLQSQFKTPCLPLESYFKGIAPP